MKRTLGSRAGILGCVSVVLLLSTAAQARIPWPVAKSYEDTVRVAVLWTSKATCYSDICPGVDQYTRDFVLASLEGVANVKILPSSSTLAQVQALWPGINPHVIVHINAGFAACSGPTVVSIMDWAVQNYIGVAEIGDDAAYLTTQVFDWSYQAKTGSNLPMPMYTAQWLNQPGDSLWLKTEPVKDILMDSTKYPFLTGIVRNATIKIANGNTKFYFKPVGNIADGTGRCEADPDSFVANPGKLTFLGYQQGWNATGKYGTGDYDDMPGSTQGLVGTTDQFVNIAAFQDSIPYLGGYVLRRAVALSYEPQYLINQVASQQIVYDAIMYASLAHKLRPAKIEIAVSSDTIMAGQYANLSATILPADMANDLKLQLAATVRWGLDRRFYKTGDTLTKVSGPSSDVTGTMAFRSIHVVASLWDDGVKDTVRDTATIYVKAGADYRVWIEKTATPTTRFTQISQIMPTSFADSTTARPLAVIQLDSVQLTAYAYAVVRDQYGNIKRAATNGSWEALPPAGPISAAPTPSPKLWEGTITRNTGGEDSIRAWEATPAVLIPDTVKVVVNLGVLTGLRIVDQAGNPITTPITINTDQEQVFRVQGQWSDKPGVWSDFNAVWSMNPSIPSANPIPAGEISTWTFSPTTPGGPATVTVRNQANTKTATVTITVTPAPPSRVEFVLLEQSPVAGVPFATQVKIYNTDGLVPGSWCFPGPVSTGQVAYQDIMMRPGQNPKVVTGETTDGVVNLRPATTNQVSECFVGGIDTAMFTLYYAPQSTDSSHQLWVGMQGASGRIEASTAPFLLLPGPVDSIVLMTGDIPAPRFDTLAAPTGFLYATVWGYDAYGNLASKAVPSSWSQTDALHPVPPGPASTLYYATTTVVSEENGCIVARSTIGNTNAADSICLHIVAPKITITQAITRDVRDASGKPGSDGYLDRIEVHFSLPTTMDAVASDQKILVNYRGRTEDAAFTVTSVVQRDTNAASDTVFYIELKQVENNQPQTNWLPSIQILGYKDITEVEAPTTDGAGPVIWRVVKKIVNVGDRKKDEVTVTFSELLEKVPGPTDKPATVFVVWTKNDAGGYVAIDSLLEGIDYFLVSADGASVAKFQMLNGNNLTAYNYLSIKMVGNPPVVDKVGKNPPEPVNRKTIVEVTGMPFTVTVAPTPFSPTAKQFDGGEFLVHTGEEALEAVLHSEGGTAIIIEFIPPSEGANITIEYLVHDLAGNLVFHDDADYVSPKSTSENGSVQLGLIWNGMSDKGMKAQPGIYRGVVKVISDFLENDRTTTSRMSATVSLGVTR